MDALGICAVLRLPITSSRMGGTTSQCQSILVLSNSPTAPHCKPAILLTAPHGHILTMNPVWVEEAHANVYSDGALPLAQRPARVVLKSRMPAPMAIPTAHEWSLRSIRLDGTFTLVLQHLLDARRIHKCKLSICTTLRRCCAAGACWIVAGQQWLSCDATFI